MRLVLCRSVWGLEADPARWPARLPGIAAAGFDAVGLPIQQVPDSGALVAGLRASGLELVAQVFTFGRTVHDHLEMLEDGLRRSAAAGARHAVVQGGRDGWDLDTSLTFLRAALRTAAELGVDALHETHRSRILFSPWVSERVLGELPGLRLAVDLSHWTCVTESLRLPDRIVDLVAARAGHLDARVGWEQGPQVADPRVDRHAGHVETFERWWDVVWSVQRSAGTDALAVQPEFGPPPYQPVDPRSGEPLADVNDVNEWMGRRLRERYGGHLREEPTDQ